MGIIRAITSAAGSVLKEQWREYYLEALWREAAPCGSLPRGKCDYWLLIAERR